MVLGIQSTYHSDYYLSFEMQLCVNPLPAVQHPLPQPLRTCKILCLCSIQPLPHEFVPRLFTIFYMTVHTDPKVRDFVHSHAPCLCVSHNIAIHFPTFFFFLLLRRAGHMQGMCGT